MTGPGWTRSRTPDPRSGGSLGEPPTPGTGAGPMLRPMLSSRLSKLLLAALVAAFAIPAAASASMITYVDGKNLWVGSPDGAVKRQLTTDGTAQHPYHVPSADDQGSVAAVKGGLTNSKILVHIGAD